MSYIPLILKNASYWGIGQFIKWTRFFMCISSFIYMFCFVPFHWPRLLACIVTSFRAALHLELCLPSGWCPVSERDQFQLKHLSASGDTPVQSFSLCEPQSLCSVGMHTNIHRIYFIHTPRIFELHPFGHNDCHMFVSVHIKVFLAHQRNGFLRISV